MLEVSFNVAASSIESVKFELEVRSFEHPGSPFRRTRAEFHPELQHSAALVSSVTDEFEADWAAKRAANLAATVGFTPTLPREKL